MIRRLLLTWQLVKRLDVLEAIAAKIEALQGILDYLDEAEKRLPTEEALEEVYAKLEHLDTTIARIENLGKPEPVPVQSNGSPKPVTVKEHLTEWARLKLLSEFVALSSHAEEIEKEWQRIQQDEHDYQYAFNANANDDTQAAFIYRKGLADGIKWVKTLKERFS